MERTAVTPENESILRIITWSLEIPALPALAVGLAAWFRRGLRKPLMVALLISVLAALMPAILGNTMSSNAELQAAQPVSMALLIGASSQFMMVLTIPFLFLGSVIGFWISVAGLMREPGGGDRQQA